MFNIIVSAATDFWKVFDEMAPYLLFGFLVAGALSVLIPSRAVERHLGGRGILPILKASLFGIPLPLCSCGVIPVAASLHRSGANRGATTAFLISTPQTGVDSIFVTYGLLGTVFAVFRPFAALFSGLVGGWLVSAVAPASDAAEPANVDQADSCHNGEKQTGKIRGALHYGLVRLPRDIGPSLLIGLAIAGAISVAIPEHFFGEALGQGIFAMLVMMVLGIPVYVCATASVPVALALIGKGISPGAALVFLMTGPATNAAGIAIVWRLMGRRATVVYLATVALSALACGLLLDYIFEVTVAPVGPHIHEFLPPWLHLGSSITLLAILTYALVYRRLAGGSAVSEPMPAAGRTATLRVDGMTCEHCAQTVQQALAQSAGVDFARVDLKSATAVVGGESFEVGSLRRVVESLGYKAGEIENSLKGTDKKEN